MHGYMFDTNIFNAILDGDMDIEAIADGVPIYVTHVQLDEIRATRNDARRMQLESAVRSVPHRQLLTRSVVVDVSRWDEARISDGVLFRQLRDLLDALNNRKENNARDILIAETAIAEGLVLVTNDRDLFRIVADFGGAVCDLRQFEQIALHGSSCLSGG